MLPLGEIIRVIIKRYPGALAHLDGKARWLAMAFSTPQDNVKTYDHYRRQIRSGVADLYNGVITQGDFVDYMSEIIPQQLTKAWRSAMVDNGLDPDEDMIEEWQLELDGMILSEYDFVDGFAAAIVEAAQNEAGLDAMYARADLWANRYNDVYNTAIMMTNQGTDRMVWRLGKTEEHCETCAALNGIVAFTREWEQSRFRPQYPPNDLLDCGGWRCDCSLEYTEDRRTKRALDRLLDIAQRRAV